MPHRILVADKDPSSQDTVSRLLSDAENEFIGVSSSGELKDAIKNQRPDLIILNSVLADVPGWRIVKRIKDSKDYGHVPILLMTGDPGGPPPAKMHTAGADGYLSKPIEGAALKGAVESLLGMTTQPSEIDEEITIEFDGDEVGEMTGEVYLEEGAFGEQDSGPPVGDTVEIETGTMAAELDALAAEDGAEYEDTVKLNLDDLDLEDLTEDSPAIEPTIELVTDISLDDIGDEITVDSLQDEDAQTEIAEPTQITDLPEEEPLPDFAGVTADVDDLAATETDENELKDSVTVEMDMDDLELDVDSGSGEIDLGLEADADEGLELDTSEPEIELDAGGDEVGFETGEGEPMFGESTDMHEPEMDEIETEPELELDEGGEDIEFEEGDDGLQLDIPPADTLDPESTEIDRLLEVQDPTMVLTSDDLQLEDESLSQDTYTTQGVDVIDLEEDSELAEVQLDELEPITTSVDIPVSEELDEEEAPGELDTAEIDESEFGLDLDEADDETDTHDAAVETEEFSEELSINGMSEEEITTEEFFGDDLPTEEFPMEQFHGEATEDLSLEQEISFEEPGFNDKVGELKAQQEEAVDDSPALGLADSAEIRLDDEPEDEPLLEVTEDILLDEVSFEDDEEAATEELSQAVKARDTIAEEPISIQESAPEQELALEPEPAPVLDLELEPEPEPKREPAPVLDLELEPEPEPVEQVPMPVHAPAVGEQPPAPGASLEQIRDLFSALLDEKLASLGPLGGDQLSTADITSMLPGNRVAADDVVKQISQLFPSREEVFARVDDLVRSSLPSKEEIDQKVERAIDGVLPARESVLARLEEALQSLPSQDEIARRLDEVRQSLPSPEVLNQTFESALQGIPSKEEFELRVNEALSTLPSAETISQALEISLQNIIPRDDLLYRIDDFFASLPSGDVIRSRVDEAFQNIVSADDIESRLEQAFQAFPSKEEVHARLDNAINTAIPADEMGSRIDQISEVIASIDGLRDQLESTISGIPSGESIQSRFNTALEAIPSEEVISKRLEEAFAAFPSEEVVHNRFEQTLAAFPKSGEVTDRINEALKAIPSEDVIQDRLEKALGAFPKPEDVADQINDAMKALPTREEIEHRLEQVLDAFPKEEDINGRLNQAISQIPDRQAILDHIDESVQIMPTAEDVLSRLDGRFQSIMPTRGEIQQSLSAMMESKVDHALKQVDLPGLVKHAAPDAEQFLEEIRSALPDRARFQDTIAQGINLAIENALPERMWLESLSKGLFDERTRGLLPSKDEVASILREEIRYKLLETVERIVRAQLERISTELNV